MRPADRCTSLLQVTSCQTCTRFQPDADRIGRRSHSSPLKVLQIPGGAHWRRADTECPPAVGGRAERYELGLCRRRGSAVQLTCGEGGVRTGLLLLQDAIGNVWKWGLCQGSLALLPNGCDKSVLVGCGH